MPVVLREGIKSVQVDRAIKVSVSMATQGNVEDRKYFRELSSSMRFNALSIHLDLRESQQLHPNSMPSLKMFVKDEHRLSKLVLDMNGKHASYHALLSQKVQPAA